MENKNIDVAAIFDKLSCIIEYDELSSINFGDKTENIAELLDEDLLQMRLEEDSLLIDVGWYSSFDTEGEFVLLIIKNGDWENPFLRKSCKTYTELEALLIVVRDAYE